MKGGILVTWVDKDNKTQKGIVFHDDQTVQFKTIKKVLVTYIDELMRPQRNEKNQIRRTLKDPNLLKTLGYVD